MGKLHILITIHFLCGSLIFAMGPAETSDCSCQETKEDLSSSAHIALGLQSVQRVPFYIFKQSPHENEEAVCKRLYNMFDSILYAKSIIYEYFCVLSKGDDFVCVKRFFAEQRRALGFLFKTFSNVESFRAALCGDQETMRFYEERMYALVNGLDGVDEETQKVVYSFLDGIEEEVQGLFNLSGVNECLLKLMLYDEPKERFHEKLTEENKNDFYEHLSDFLAKIESNIDFYDSFAQDSEMHLKNAHDKYRKFYAYANNKYMMEEEQQACYFWDELRRKLSERITDINKVLNCFCTSKSMKNKFFEVLEKFMDDLTTQFCQDKAMQELYGDEIRKYIFERQTFLKEKLVALKIKQLALQETGSVAENKYWS